jgi:hypothetical protein
MSLTMIILINVAFDLAIISALAFVMSRAARLAPGLQVPHPATPRTQRRAVVPRATRQGRARARVGAAFD